MGAADGVREKRYYPIQNWRADVVAVTEGTGIRMESVRYSPYGVPTVLSDADYDQDGDVDSADETAFNTDYGGGTNLKADLDWDGTIDGQDDTVFDLLKADADGSSIYKAPGDSRGTLSIYGLRKGYAGYENGGIIVKLAHVRHRVLDHETGRWTRRDPAGYVDGENLLSFNRDGVPSRIDSDGMASLLTTTSNANTASPIGAKRVASELAATHAGALSGISVLNPWVVNPPAPPPRTPLNPEPFPDWDYNAWPIPKLCSQDNADVASCKACCRRHATGMSNWCLSNRLTYDVNECNAAVQVWITKCYESCGSLPAE